MYIVSRQLERMKEEDPDRRVIFILFSSEVTILGDCGEMNRASVDTNIKNNHAKLLEKGQGYLTDIGVRCLSESYRYVYLIWLDSFPLLSQQTLAGCY